MLHTAYHGGHKYARGQTYDLSGGRKILESRQKYSIHYTSQFRLACIEARAVDTGVEIVFGLMDYRTHPDKRSLIVNEEAQQNRATTVQVEESSSTTQGDTKMNNTTQAQTQKFITQDLALQKVTMLVNEFLKEIQSTKQKFQMNVFYKTSNPIMYSEGFHKSVFGRILDEFHEFELWFDDDSITNPCFLNIPKMWFGIGLGDENPTYLKLIKKVEKINRLNIESFLSGQNQKINLIELMHEHPELKKCFNSLNLVEMDYCFNVDFENDELSDDATLVLTIGFVDNKKAGSNLVRHIFKYNLKNIIDDKYLRYPRCYIQSIPISALAKCIYKTHLGEEDAE